MLALLLPFVLNAQEFTVTYQCRPEVVNVYDDNGLRKTHATRWESTWFIGEASGFAQAIELARGKVQDGFKQARDLAAELRYYTIDGMVCRKRVAAGGDPSWNNLYGRDNRMKYAPANRMRDERELKVASAKGKTTYAAEPSL